MPDFTREIALEIRRRYEALMISHVTELEEWVSLHPENWPNEGQSVRDYCSDYSDQFGIAAAVSMDCGYPRANAMADELSIFDPIFNPEFSIENEE